MEAAQPRPHSERIAVLEMQMRAMQEQHREMNGKLDRLLEAAAMGRGAWGLTLRVGGAIAMLGGLLGGIATLWHAIKGG